MSQVDVLVPTFGRRAALAVTLTTLAFQRHPDVRVVISALVDRRVNAPAVLPVAPPPAKQRAENGEAGRRVSL